MAVAGALLFALLFGLSMDYEVFLIRRMQEQWLASGDNEDAVATGLARTARPILALVRLLLVPAIMKLAGRANWWLPDFLERHLPRIRMN